MLGKAVIKIHDKTSPLANTLNFSVNRKKLSQHISDVRKSPLVWDKHAGIYIGKMLANPTSDSESIYTEKRLEGMLLSALHDTNNEGVVHLYLCPILYELLGDENLKKPILSFQEQKDKIYAIAKKAKIPTEKISIHNIYDSHKELFDNIKSYGLSTLNAGEVLPPKDFSSYELARFFYTLSQKYPLIKNEFSSLLADGLKDDLEENDPLAYYGMLECAFRLADNANGIATQGGLISQKKFDTKIKRLLSGKTGNKELDIFAGQVAELGIQMYDRRYFKHNEYDDVLKKQQDKNKISSKIRNIAIMTSIAVASAIGGGYTLPYLQKQHEMNQKDKNFVERMNNTNVIGDSKLGESLLNSWDYTYRDIFQTQFGITDNDILNKIKYSFLERYRQGIASGKYNSGYHSSDYDIKDVIEDYILSKKTDLEEFYGLSITPTKEKFARFEEAFYNTATHDSLPKNIRDFKHLETIQYPSEYGGMINYKIVTDGQNEYAINEDNPGSSSYLAKSYFTPLNSRYIAQKLQKSLEEIAPGGPYLYAGTTQNHLQKLRIQGYNIDYLLGIEQRYNYHNAAILGTFFKDIIQSDKLKEYDKTSDIETILHSITKAGVIKDGMHNRIVSLTPHSRNWNKLFSAIFNILQKDPVIYSPSSKLGIDPIIQWIGEHQEEIAKQSGLELYSTSDIDIFSYVKKSENGISNTKLEIKKSKDFTGELILRNYGIILKGEYELSNGEIFSRGYMKTGIMENEKVLIAAPKNEKLKEKYFNEYITQHFNNIYPYRPEDNEIVAKIEKINKLSTSEKIHNIKEYQYWNKTKDTYQRIKKRRSELHTVFNNYNSFYGELLYKDLIKNGKKVTL